MPIFRTLLISGLVLLMLVGSAVAQSARFAVIADPHLYDSELGTTGPAFEAYLAKDRKMLRESEAILASALERIEHEQPDFVILPGDLTKDGEMSSHFLLAGHLADLEAAGIEVFVIPGNHDINNPHAVAYDGDEKIPVNHVTPYDFTVIYGDFGYDQAIARDPASLSYVAEPVDGLWLFGIDSCRYAFNIAKGHPQTGGGLAPETLKWLLDKLSEARMKHKRVVGFMHHGALAHYTGQDQLYADYLVDNWDEVSRILSAAGLQLLFTGHYHANDITQSEWEENRLYDVETGSLVTYPSPYRMVDLHGADAAVVRTFYVDQIDFDTQGLSFPDHAKAFLAGGLTQIAADQLTLPPEQGGFSLSAEEASKAAPFVAQAFMAHYAGDEMPDTAVLQQLQGYLPGADPRYQALGQALGALWRDLPPSDGSAVLPLRPALSLAALGTYATGIFDEGAAEISAYDPRSKTLFVVNGRDRAVDMLDISDPVHPVQVGSIDVSPYGQAPNSVATHDGLVAVAVEAAIKQDPGKVVLFDASGDFLKAFAVGALPDMVTFTPDGRFVLCANEGEPNDDYTIDPEGSVSIVDLSRGLPRAKVRTADFQRFNRKKDALVAGGVRIFGPNATVAQDLEPEFISVLPNSPYAWVSLQENNAIARIHIRSGRVMDILPLGVKDYGLPGNGLDASDKDGSIHIQPYDRLFGMYMPDAIEAYPYKGDTYIVTANEGDARDYDAFGEEARIRELTLDPGVFPDAGTLQADDLLGRLTVTTTLGDTDGDGDVDRLFAFGARSFTIFKATRKGLVPVYDSGDQFEQIIAAALPKDFNADNDENGSFDSRSDAKGPEPEGLVVGTIGNRTYAFIGLERVGGIMVYDITRPYAAQFVTYLNNRDFTGDAATGTAGDLGPEGITFIPARQSPDGHPMLAVANEVSGTTTLYRIEDHRPAAVFNRP